MSGPPALCWWPLAATACVVSLLMGDANAAETPAARTVVTIHLGAESYPSNPVLDATIRDALLAHVDSPIDYFAEYLKDDVLPPEDASRALADYIGRTFQRRRIDLVIAMTDRSLRFVLDHRRELFPDAPVVFATLSVPGEVLRSDGRFTGIRMASAYAQTLALALQLHPSTQRVFVVAHSPGAETVDAVRGELRASSGQTPLTYLDYDTVAGLVNAVKAVPPRSVILYIWHAQKEPGNLVYPDEIARRVALAAAVPVYGTSDFYLGSGIVGGVMRRTAETGTRVGELASRILNGERPGDIPIETARMVPILDWRQLQRWNIPRGRLPQGAEVRYEVPSAWQVYRPYIIAAIAVVMAQLLLIAGLLTQRARRRRAEQATRASETALRTSYERTRHLAGRLINAQEAAHAHIARDLHDGVGQQVAEVALEIGTLQRSSAHLQDAGTQQALRKIQDDTRAMSDEIRRLSHELHPATLRLVGLTTALNAHCIEVAKRHHVQVSCTSAGDLKLHPDLAVDLFRIAQEALRNGIVHGRARRLAVSLSRSGEYVELVVTDDGRGFDVERVRAAGSGLGLVSIEERAHAFGGSVHIASGPQGTTIRVRGLARTHVENVNPALTPGERA